MGELNLVLINLHVAFYIIVHTFYIIIMVLGIVTMRSEVKWVEAMKYLS